MCVCVAAGVVGLERLPVCSVLLQLPGGEVVLHQGPARGESHLLRLTSSGLLSLSTQNKKIKKKKKLINL